MMRFITTAGAAIAALVASAAPAQTVGSARTRDYVAAAGGADAFEMLEADTALAQSTDPAVRAFAQAMLRDHGRLDEKLRRAAVSARLDPPAVGVVGADQAPLLGALQGLRGTDFDRAYWQHQAIAHRAALTTAQRYAADGDDATIRQAAQAALPVISAHLAMIPTAP